MPRLARPIPNDQVSRQRVSPARKAFITFQDCCYQLNFAAINIPSSLSESLREIKPPFLDFPWLRPEPENELHPSRNRLQSVRNFFRYTEEQDVEFFKQLDRDSDGKITVDDLKECLRRYKLPSEYANQFIERARGGRWWASSVSFDEFKSLADDNESKMLRAFCSLEVDAKGSLDLNTLKGSLAKLDLPATDSNARAMLKALGKAEDASIAYGEFRRFAILMPREKLMCEKEANLTWFESATCVPIGGTIEQGLSTVNVLIKAALAGGMSSGLSTLMMHPLDTLKTRIQSIPGASIRSVVADIPNIGKTALYRGIIPAGAGAFSSHGIRTCAYEAGIIGMSSFGIPFLQAQPLASLLGTFVGTLVRIPCEVLKQQLQCGNHKNVKRAFSQIVKLDGTAGFFRGAGALMFREVPFYVAGMVLYEQYKRCLNGEYFGSQTRQLSTPETIAIGALAGASASFLTTPADVVKSRLMTAAAGSTMSTSKIIVDLIQKEGVWALFKGALPRAVWIAPLGAMNFAGYELAKRAMGVSETSDAGRGESETNPAENTTPLLANDTDVPKAAAEKVALAGSHEVVKSSDFTDGNAEDSNTNTNWAAPQAGGETVATLDIGRAPLSVQATGSEQLAKIWTWPWVQEQENSSSLTEQPSTVTSTCPWCQRQVAFGIQENETGVQDTPKCVDAVERTSCSTSTNSQGASTERLYQWTWPWSKNDSW